MDRTYHFTLQLAGNERRRASALPPGPERQDAKGWARDLLASARKRRVAAAA